MSASLREGGGDQPPQESVVDCEQVPSSLVEIAPALGVANDIESLNPRVAYLCRFYAFEMAHRLDPASSGHGVHQFKTALLQRLERENEPTLMERVKKSDAREIQSFYQQYYKKYIQALQNSADKTYGAVLTKACQTAAVIFEVLKALAMTQSLEVGPETTEIHSKIKEMKLYGETDSADQAILQSPETYGCIKYSIKFVSPFHKFGQGSGVISAKPGVRIGNSRWGCQ